jgi:hypothetical protein
MKKVALVSPYPLDDSTPYTSRPLRYCAFALKKLGMHCEFFSFSDKQAAAEISGFKQHTIISEMPLGNQFSTARYMDLASLALLGFRPSIEKINNSPILIKELVGYAPDIVILYDIIIAKLIKKYITKYKSPKTKILCHVDSYGGIPAEIEDNIRWLEINNKSPLKIKFIKTLKRNYIKYYRGMYEQQLRASDAFLTPALEHKKELTKEFPEFKDKIFPLCPEWREFKPSIGKPKRKLETIMFVGSYMHIPNAMAIKNITDVIAPAMPDKKFIIFGVGCPNEKRGNIQFINGAKLSVQSYLKKADLCIAPFTTYNGGVKTKILDYIQSNKIVMGTTSAFIGYTPIDNVNSIIEDKISNYPNRIKELENNYELRCKIQKNIHTLMKNNYEKTVMQRWHTVLKHIGEL